MENIYLLILGLFVSVIGIVNMTGNISTIHSYNRRKVREEDAPAYGRAVGIGTLVIGIAIIAYFVLMLFDLSAIVPFVMIPAVIIGIGFILYGQFKYNGGLF